VDSAAVFLVDLAQAGSLGEEQVGGKACNLSRLQRQGLTIPDGFCLTVAAYESFLDVNHLSEVITAELGRKPLETMRWEELWDAALRIRSQFARSQLPDWLVDELTDALKTLGADRELVVRSSAPGEDGANRSFAGLHESYVGVVGIDRVCEKILQVWASLWSDAALLYRRELNLNPRGSRMAVVIQKLIRRNRSGVAFGRDPRDLSKERAIIEAVPGLCSDLVDGVIDPQRWSLDRISGKVLSSPTLNPLLEKNDLDALLRILLSLEEKWGWAADLEWTGRRERLILLQARPITGLSNDPEDKRAWYLTLSPSSHRMRELCNEVVNQLVPQLEKDGRRLSEAHLESLTTRLLITELEERDRLLRKWEEIYWEKFIPFAHGVRQFGRYYNDAIKPENPYEFVELLETERMLALNRNEALAHLARIVRENRALAETLEGVLSVSASEDMLILDSIREIEGGKTFLTNYKTFVEEHGDLAFQKTYLKKRPDLFLKNILALAQNTEDVDEEGRLKRKQSRATQLEQNLIRSVEDPTEARDFLRIARLSWRLRDDDNILMGRLEAQFLRAIEVGRIRLEALKEGNDRDQLVELLTNLEKKESKIKSAPQSTQIPSVGETPRQLVGQPAAPGLGKGRARCVRDPEDLGEFSAGEILVCDAIQPTMTHLVPLAAGVVERRGGMLIHGAIIARELGIPCVNGIQDALAFLQNGDLLTVDGYLGIVSVGEATLDLEASGRPSS
jgi:pyruvate,water dikinase